MSTQFPIRLREIRNADYTGKNRCYPCTIVNVALAAIGSIVVAIVSRPVAAVAFGAALAVIYLRGYLVPGTPAITRRYFPGWLLAVFDKRPDRTPEIEHDVVPESILRTAGVLDDTDDGDVRVRAEFERDLRDRTDDLDSDRAIRRAIGALLAVDPEAVSVSDGASTAVRVDGVPTGRWESKTALRVDLAANELLTERHSGWASTGLDARSEVLGALRLCLDRCPDCETRLSFGHEVVESCCRTHDVIAVSCPVCDARLFEVGANPDELSRTNGEH
ncbi:MAG: hypothetical protein ACQETB_13495 [Halobacteriota archaeon]